MRSMRDFVINPLSFGLLLILSLAVVESNFICICTNEVETPVFETRDSSTAPIGYLYEFDCKPQYDPDENSTQYFSIMFEKKVSLSSQSSLKMNLIWRNIFSAFHYIY